MRQSRVQCRGGRAGPGPRAGVVLLRRPFLARSLAAGRCSARLIDRTRAPARTDAPAPPPVRTHARTYVASGAGAGRVGARCGPANVAVHWKGERRRRPTHRRTVALGCRLASLQSSDQLSPLSLGRRRVKHELGPAPHQLCRSELTGWSRSRPASLELNWIDRPIHEAYVRARATVHTHPHALYKYSSLLARDQLG